LFQQQFQGVRYAFASERFSSRTLFMERRA
jgi:hypothetical protein